MATLPESPDALALKVAQLPESPGVYLWKDAEGTVLYVGKAKRLRARVRSYLSSDATTPSKTRRLMLAVRDLDTIVVATESEALVLEANLIKEHKPRYNILLRDDKSYPFIKVTAQEPFPRVFVTRRVLDDGARYFGPYTDVGAMRHALNVVKRLYTVRSCSWDLMREAPERACLDWHIGRCKAPCVGLQTQADYGAMIAEVLLFLDGRTGDVVRLVRERMLQASEALDFERAAELRDALKHLDKMEEPVAIAATDGGDRDVIGYARDGDDACVAVLRIRDGKLLARDHRLLANVEDEADGDVLGAYLAGAWPAAEERASELLVPFEFADRELLQAAVPGLRILAPQRGSKREMLELADRNARHLLEEFKLAADEADERAADPVYELQRELGLQTVPRAITCFDISHAQGTDTVASAVWFENGRPRRSEYRKFKVKTVEGIDDFASMREVVGRYVARRQEEGRPLPDLILIDGGKGQLGAAHDALVSAGLGAMPLISLAKRDELVFMLGRAEGVQLSRRSRALRMLQQARDEAHRFAITFQRQQRTKRTVTSALLDIPGIGPTKRRSLLHKFGSIDAVRAATPEAIAELPGFSVAGARRLLEALAASAPTRADGPAQAMHADATTTGVDAQAVVAADPGASSPDASASAATPAGRRDAPSAATVPPRDLLAPDAPPLATGDAAPPASPRPTP
ncbi:MAG: excinuclease ABC subunit UvrC [Gemmatimonadetes bacterium]|nr:excinuclease ABC subunit UvrC [Gemmatimonadota bacterium]